MSLALDPIYRGKSFYVDQTIVSHSAKKKAAKHSERPDIEALDNIWTEYAAGAIWLCTCKADIRMEFIWGLMKIGCHVRNVLHIREELDGYKRWTNADHGSITKIEKALDYYERLEDLDLRIGGLAGDYGAGEGPLGVSDDEHHTLSKVRDVLLQQGEASSRKYKSISDEREILLEVAPKVREVYADNWHRRMQLDYNTHWSLLEEARRRRGLPTNVRDKAMIQEFSTLNKLVVRLCGFYPSGHITAEVLCKEIDETIDGRAWRYSQPERDSRHIFHCLKYQVDYFLTMDGPLTQNFVKRYPLVKPDLNAHNMELKVIRPSAMFIRS